MPIRKVDGRRFLDSGVIIVDGDAVIEISLSLKIGTTVLTERQHSHEIALKFRTEGGDTQVRFGNPNPNRTVVHFVDFPWDAIQANGGAKIGVVGDEALVLAYVIEPFRQAPPMNVRKLTYSLYAGR